MHDGTFAGRSAIRERLARDLTACPDAAYTVGSFVEQGDSFADEWTFAGTHTGPFLLPDGTQLPPTGKRLEIKGMELVVGARREDHHRQPVLRRHGHPGPVRSPPAGRDVMAGTPLLERVTASDLFLLLWDDYGWSSDIGGLAILRRHQPARRRRPDPDRGGPDAARAETAPGSPVPAAAVPAPAGAGLAPVG